MAGGIDSENRPCADAIDDLTITEDCTNLNWLRGNVVIDGKATVSASDRDAAVIAREVPILNDPVRDPLRDYYNLTNNGAIWSKNIGFDNSRGSYINIINFGTISAFSAR